MLTRRNTFGRRNESAMVTDSLNFSHIRLKNVMCIFCQRQFQIKDFTRSYYSSSPLVMKCGHTICDMCVKKCLGKQCPGCPTGEYTLDTASLPFNIYALGIAASIQTKPATSEDPDLTFRQANLAKLRQSSSHDYCNECGIHAVIKCAQCKVLFCFSCFSKIHGRALQDHKKILLAENSATEMLNNICPNACKNSIEYFCNTCDSSLCSGCILKLHQKHDYIEQRLKNEEVLPNFQKIYDRIAESLERVNKIQENLRELSRSTDLENSKEIRHVIHEHFTHLHGILQNVEQGILEKLDERKTATLKNFQDIESRLLIEENQLQSALLVATSARENLDKISLQNLIKNLEPLADVPCHLVRNLPEEQQKINLTIDKSIFDLLKSHCIIEVPNTTIYTLMEQKNLPKDYQIEPLTDNNVVLKLLDKTPSQTLEVSVPKKPLEYDSSGTSGALESVDVTHIITPAHFYLRKTALFSEYNSLSSELTLCASTTAPPQKEIILRKFYIVQCIYDKKWYRARVTDINNEKDGISYNVFYIDSGKEESKVPLARFRELPSKLASQMAMAIKCSLYDIVPRNDTWSIEAIDFFRELLNNSSDKFISMHHHMDSCGGTNFINLLVHHEYTTLSVREVLIFLAYGKYVSSQSLMAIPFQIKNHQSVRKFFKETLDLHSYVEATCEYLESPESIYIIKTGHNKKYLDELIENMTKEYNTNKNNYGLIYMPDLGMECAVQDSHDHKWYRAYITGIPDVKMISVFYVDIGKTVTIPYNQARKLTKEFMQSNVQAIKVSLRYIQSQEKWCKDTIKYMKQRLLKKKFIVTAYEQIDDYYSVIILMNDDISFNTLLVDRGGATYTEEGILSSNNNYLPQIEDTKKHQKIRNKKNKKINKEMSKCDSKNEADPYKVGVIVHHVESPDCIIVSDATRQEAHIQMTKEMQEFYNKYHSNDRTVTEGTACVVYSQKDKCYCRARVKKVLSEEAVVYLYDLGFDETVSLKDIQPLKPEFTKLPAYMFTVKLAGITPCGGTDKWASDTINTLKNLIYENEHNSFYISKLSNSDDASISVELFVNQLIIDGPLSPTRNDTNSINKLLVTAGFALPIRDYSDKRDNILAVELKRQLQIYHKAQNSCNDGIKWYVSTDESNVPTLVQIKQVDASFGSITDSNELGTAQNSNTVKSWLPAEPLDETESFIGKPTNVDEEGYVYLYPTEQNEDKINFIKSCLESVYKNIKITPDDENLSNGDLCIAKYYLDEQWYRGLVQEVLSDKTALIKFVDYGNVEKFKLGKGVISKKIQLQEIPIQCTKCKVYGLESPSADGKWTKEELDKLHVTLVDHECVIEVISKEDTCTIVKITLLPINQDIVSYMKEEFARERNIQNDTFDVIISDEDASSTESPDGIIEEFIEESTMSDSKSNTNLSIIESLDESTAKCDDIISGSSLIIETCKGKDVSLQMETNFGNACSPNSSITDENIASSTPQNELECLFTYASLNIPKDIEFIKGEVTCWVGVTDLWIQLQDNVHSQKLNAYYMQYLNVMNELQLFAEEQPLLKSLSINAVCCSKFSDGVWYRCIIEECTDIKNTDTTNVTVRFVDYGNSEKKSVSRLNHNFREMKNEWLQCPAMSIKCCLWGTELSPNYNMNTEDETSYFIEKISQGVYNIPVFVKIKETQGNKYHVQLYTDKEFNTFVYSSLIEEGILELTA
ncbi:RING finger protein 17 isoform X2 [Prorops nasuta]|uniref:RING finger protein 17 isoform X2 n=1 Tax=Prorops nasuta TaxID=863751 RepID=UPI0034CEAF5F